MTKETKGSQSKGVRPMTSGIEGGWRKQESEVKAEEETGFISEAQKDGLDL
jgi:hypothetical protein